MKSVLGVHTWQHSSSLGGVISALAASSTRPAGQDQDWLPALAVLLSTQVACKQQAA
jgi:hypothetical protein